MAVNKEHSLLNLGKSTRFLVSFFISLALAKAFSLGFTKIFTNIFTQDELGQYGIIISAVSLVMSFSAFGFPTTLNRYAIRYRIKEKIENLRNLIFTGLVIFIAIELIIILVILIVYFAAGKAVWFLETDGNYVLILFIVGIIVATQMFSTICYTIATSFQNSRYYSIVVIMRIALHIPFALIFVLYLNLGIMGLVAGLAAAEFITAVYSAIVIIKDIGVGKFSLREFKNIIGFSLPVYYTQNLWFVFDLLLLLYIERVDSVGGQTTISLFKFGALTIVNIIMLAGNIFRMVFRPVIYKLFEREQFDDMRTITHLMFRIFILVIFPVALLIYAFSPILIPLITLADYLPSIPLIPFLLAAMICNYIQSIIAYAQGLYLKIYWNAIVGSISFGLAFLVAYFVIPINALIGIGAAMLTLRFTYLVGTALASNHYFKIQLDLKMILSIVGVITFTLGLGIIFYYFVFDFLGLYNIVASFTIPLVMYLVLVLVTRLIKKEDITYFIGLFKNYLKDVKEAQQARLEKISS